MKQHKSSFFTALAIIFASSYLLNLLWEVAHSMLYNWNISPLKNDVYFYIPKILQATFADALIISGIFLLNCLFRKGCKWIFMPKRADYLLFISAGLISSIIIEVNALSRGLWAYSQHMPLVFGIGLTPLIQLAITGMIVISSARRVI